MAFDHAQSPRLGQPTPVENPGVRLVTLETLPEVAYAGQIVYLLDLDEFRVHDGVAWQNPTAAHVPGTQTFVGPTAPAADAIGDLWMNNTTYQLSVWDGTAWKPAVDPVAQAAAIAASAAQVKAEQALGLAAGKSTIWYLPTQPAPPDQVVIVGDFWINTVTNKLYKFDTLTTVVEVQDQDIVNALNSAGTAQATADQKIETFTVLWADRPLDLGPLGIGDILFAVDQGNASYRWDGADWVALGASSVTSVTVTDGFALSSGAVGHVQTASSMLLDGAVTPPSVPPTYSQTYPATVFPIPSYFTPTYFTSTSTRMGGVCFDATYMYVAVNQYNTGRTRALGAVYRYRRSDNTFVSKHDYGLTDRYEIIDMASDGTHLHMAIHNCQDDAWWLQRVVLSTMAIENFVSRQDTSVSDYIGIDADGTNVWLAAVRASDGLFRVTKYDNTYTFIDNLYSAKPVTSYFKGLEVGTYPGLGGLRAVSPVSFDSSVASVQSFTMTSSTSSLTAQTGEEWEVAPAISGGIAHDGTNFQQISRVVTSANSFTRYKYSNDTWTTTAAGTRWVSADYRATNSTTGAVMYRTTQSTKTKIVGLKRASLQITAPKIPPDPNPGVDGDVDSVGIYIGTGTTEPATSGMWLQTPELAVGGRTLTIGDSGPVLTGVHPLSVSTFPTAAAGALASTSLRADLTPRVSINGLGVANLDGLLPPGTMVVWAGVSTPAGWKLCNGASLNTALFPDLFGAISYTFGGSGTSFLLPNLTPGTSLSYIIKT